MAAETLAIYFCKSAELMSIEFPGVPRRRYENLDFPEVATWMASTACSEACLALCLRVELSCMS